MERDGRRDVAIAQCRARSIDVCRRERAVPDVDSGSWIGVDIGLLEVEFGALVPGEQLEAVVQHSEVGGP